MCITVSPYIPGEAIAVTENGGVYLWSCEHSLRTVHQPNHVLSNDLPWYQCVFAANPRCIALADAKGMDLVDFRVSDLILTPFLFSFHNVFSRSTFFNRTAMGRARFIIYPQFFFLSVERRRLPLASFESRNL